MIKLHEIKYDEEKWVIKGNILVNKENYYAYQIRGDVIGINQITEETFLVYERIYRYEWEICRLKFENSKCIQEFKKRFREYNILSDDKIMFDKDMVYSISKNAEVEEFNWLKYKKLHVYKLEEQEEKTILFVEDSIISSYGEEYVQVVVDTDNFKPLTDAFSTLRNRMIPLTDKFTFEDLVKEDKKYKSIIDSYIDEIYSNTRTKGREKLLSKF